MAGPTEQKAFVADWPKPVVASSTARVVFVVAKEAFTAPTATTWVAFGIIAIMPVASNTVVVDRVAFGIVVEEVASYRGPIVAAAFVRTTKEVATSNITAEASSEVVGTGWAAINTVAARADRSFVVIRTVVVAFQDNLLAILAVEALPVHHRLGVD